MAGTLQRILLALPALASSACAAELSGTMYGATGKLPVAVKMRAESLDKSPAIAGTVENGRAPDFWKRMASEDQLREERLAQIIADKGWPSRRAPRPHAPGALAEYRKNDE